MAQLEISMNRGSWKAASCVGISQHFMHCFIGYPFSCACDSMHDPRKNMPVVCTKPVNKPHMSVLISWGWSHVHVHSVHVCTKGMQSQDCWRAF